MPTGPQIILALKVLVSAVTILLLASIVALLLKRPRLHGRINTVFFVLTMLTVVAFETLLRLGAQVKQSLPDDASRALDVHVLYFAGPSALVLPVMFISGKMRWKRLHLVLAALFGVLWTGTLITGLSIPN